MRQARLFHFDRNLFSRSSDRWLVASGYTPHPYHHIPVVPTGSMAGSYLDEGQTTIQPQVGTGHL